MRTCHRQGASSVVAPCNTRLSVLLVKDFDVCKASRPSARGGIQRGLRSFRVCERFVTLRTRTFWYTGGSVRRGVSGIQVIIGYTELFKPNRPRASVLLVLFLIQTSGGSRGAGTVGRSPPTKPLIHPPNFHTPPHSSLPAASKAG